MAGLTSGLAQNGLKGQNNIPTLQKMDWSNSQKGNFVTLSLSGSGGGSQQQQQGNSPSVYTFPIRPEQFTLDWPARQTVTQTINGAYQDHWGQGIGTITLSGNTGWRAHGDSQDDGFKKFMALRKIHDDYCQQCGDGDPATVNLELLVAVPDGFGHYRVSSDRFRTLKSTQSPLLYRYEIQMTVLKDLTNAQNAGGSSSQAQPNLFTNNVTSTGSIVNSSSVLSDFTQQLSSVGDALMPSKTFQYVVQFGDTLNSIASNVLGNAAFVPLIIQENPKVHTDSDLSAGIVINIPILGAVLS